jgi:plastocyanin
VRSPGVPVLFLAVALLAAACGGSASPEPSGQASALPSGGASPASSAETAACQPAPEGTVPAATVTIRDFAYSPTPVTIKAGQAVAWTNEDTSTHTATTNDGGCDTKSIPKGATVALIFPKAGTYEYHCAIHATMPTAVVEVTE